MIAYLVVYCFGLLASLISMALARKDVLLDLTVVFVFVIFAGLRYQTGNDWWVYEQLFNTYSVGSDDAGLIRQNFEPLFLFLNYITSIVPEVQFMFFLISLFNGFALWRFFRKFEASFSAVFFIYFGWLYLALQMAALRYSLAISLTLLALIFFWDKRRVSSTICYIAAVGFHVFALALVPFFLVNRYVIGLKTVIAALAVSAVIAVVDVKAVLEPFAFVPFISKIYFYFYETSAYKLSIGSLLYILINLIFLTYLMRQREDSYALALARWGTLYLLIFQISFWYLPVFWNRIQMIVIIFQCLYISQVLLWKGFVHSLLLFLISAVLTLAVLVRTLLDPAMISYVPYQGYITKKVFSKDEGDGESRFFKALDIHMERNIK